MAAALFLAAPVHAAGIVPSDSTPLTITYSGTFDLANAIVPQGTQHSYVYHVQWSYSWSGTWNELFNEGDPVPTEGSFDTSHISGQMRAVWRDVHGRAAPRLHAADRARSLGLPGLHRDLLGGA